MENQEKHDLAKNGGNCALNLPSLGLWFDFDSMLVTDIGNKCPDSSQSPLL